MNNIVIRQAAIDDAQAIYQLNCEEMGYRYDPSNTAARLDFLLSREDHCILVATVDQSVVGYIHANNHDLIYSDPLKNIMGIARKLLNAVEDWAKADGAIGVRLVSGSSRTAAHCFYISCGYIKNKEQLNFSKIFDFPY